MRKAPILSSVVIGFGGYIASQSAFAGSTVVSTIASTAATAASSGSNSHTAVNLSDNEKEEIEAQIKADFANNEEGLLDYAAGIKETTIADLEALRQSEEINKNEALDKEISKKIYYLQVVKNKAAMILAERSI